MSEEAKAIQEVAKTADTAIKASEKVGGFIDRVFGGMLEDSVGLLSDKLKYYRAEKLVLLHEKTKKKLEDAGVESTNPVLPKVGIPLIESATIEEDDALHTKWANMLANAMNPESDVHVKRSYISILQDLEPTDVLILDTLVREYKNLDAKTKDSALFDKLRISSQLAIDPTQCEISLRNLLRLGCLKPGVVTSSNIRVGGHSPTSYKDTELVGITALGLEFYEAVN